MKIIIVPNEPNPNMTGRHYAIAKALVARGHEVHTLVWDLPLIMSKSQLAKHLFTSLIPKQYKYEDLHIHKIGRLPLFWPIINGVLFKRQLRRIHRDISADIIFAESYTNETAIPKELPFIYDLADDYAAPADVFGSRIYKIAFKLLGVRKTMQRQCQRAVAVTAVSKVLVDYASNFNKNARLVPNGVETDLIAKLKPAKSVPPASMIYVSGFGPWSQPIMAMEAVIAARKNFPDASLTLVGEGSEVPKIKQFITDNNAAGFIKYRGFIHDRKQVFELINQHAIGLNISEKNKWRDAAHPMKVIEYSALGKKVVSTNLAGVVELELPNIFTYDGIAGSSALEAAMEWALAEQNRSYPAVAKQVQHDYSWSVIIEELIGIFRSATKIRLNIVHVTPSYPPALGGLEKVVQVLATTQSTMGMNVAVITSKPVCKHATYTDNFPVTRLRGAVLANTTIMPSLLWRLLQVRRSSLVHLHITQAFTPEMVWLASKFRGFKYIAHVHLDVPPTGRLGFALGMYKSLLLKRVLRRAQRTVVPTEDYKSLILNKYGVATDKVIVVENATDHTILRTPKNQPHDILRLLFVGRLSAQKNIPLLLRALSYYVSTYTKKVHLNIAGNGELKELLEHQVSELGLDHFVSFKGSLSGDDLEDTYKHSDIFVLSSVAESFGLVLVEAMTKGLPIISTDIPAVRNIIHNNKNGLLVKEDPRNLADAIHRIATNKMLYGQMSVYNLSTARIYSWDKTSEHILRLYEETA